MEAARRVALVALLSLALVPAGPGRAWACTCGEADPRAVAGLADVIFTGEVTDLAPSTPGDFADVPTIGATVEVSRVYKGEPGRTVEVFTADNSAACGYSFAIHERYTLFAIEGDGSYSTGLCSGNEEGDINPHDYGLELVTTYSTATGSSNEEGTLDRDLMQAVAAGLIVVIAVAIWLVGRRRRRKRLERLL